MRQYLRTDGMTELPAKAKAQSTVKAALTDEEVGDANSFGRGINFIGTAQSGVLAIAPDCTPAPHVSTRP